MDKAQLLKAQILEEKLFNELRLEMFDLFMRKYDIPEYKSIFQSRPIGALYACAGLGIVERSFKLLIELENMPISEASAKLKLAMELVQEKIDAYSKDGAVKH